MDSKPRDTKPADVDLELAIFGARFRSSQKTRMRINEYRVSLSGISC